MAHKTKCQKGGRDRERVEVERGGRRREGRGRRLRGGEGGKREEEKKLRHKKSYRSDLRHHSRE